MWFFFPPFYLILYIFCLLLLQQSKQLYDYSKKITKTIKMNKISYRMNMVLPLEKFDVHITSSTVIWCCSNLSSLHTFIAIIPVFHSVCVFSFPSLLYLQNRPAQCVLWETQPINTGSNWMWVRVKASEHIKVWSTLCPQNPVIWSTFSPGSKGQWSSVIVLKVWCCFTCLHVQIFKYMDLSLYTDL